MWIGEDVSIEMPGILESKLTFLESKLPINYIQ